MPKITSKFEPRGKSRDLVVLFHGFMKSAERLEPICETIRGIEELKDADLLRPNLPTGRRSMVNPAGIVQKVLQMIGKQWEERKKENGRGYDRIYLIGHSLGSILARKVYVCACGENDEGPFEKEIEAKEPTAWVQKVERIILLAGMNRGWSISHHLSIPNAILWSLGVVVGNFLKFVRRCPPLIFTIRKGAPFITQLRIHWLLMRKKAGEKKVGQAMTIQILGSIDDMVSPEDNIDLITGKDFIYLDAPCSGHSSIVEMNDDTLVPEDLGKGRERVRTIGGERQKVFTWALTLSKKALEEKAVIPSDLPLYKQRRNITDVIFVIHGIRDVGYWTHKIARHVQMLAHQENKETKEEKRFFATETSSYGYFPMLSFLSPNKRRAKVEWFMDQYTESLALYPDAKRFSFVGHSNGTYLLAKALKEYPCCKFHHVVFAGSVVRRNFPWLHFIKNGQLHAVLNYVATADWVVAFFPRVLGIFTFFDLGSAGHKGFRFPNPEKSVERPKDKKDNRDNDPRHQFKYVRGGHSAALVEANWNAIAHFILNGKFIEPPEPIEASKQSIIVSNFATIFIWLLIAAFLILPGYLILSSGYPEWVQTILFILFLNVIWKVVTKV
jgi:alpha-beta hydrolase superfamily lysophospholipase